MKQKLTLLAAFVFCGLAVFWFWLRSAESVHPRPGATQTTSGSPAIGGSSALAASTAPLPGHQYRFLDWTEFCKKFNLTGWESYEIGGILAVQSRDWNEEKGRRAEVVSLDGKVLKMHVPSLGLTEEQCRRLLEARLTPLLGAKRIQEICADSKGWETLLLHVRFEDLNFDTSYTFIRTREEDVNLPPSMSEALFDAVITNRPGLPGPVRRSGDLDLTLLGADLYRLGGPEFLGWTAMAKVAAGYFRAAPILGVASRPASMVVVHTNLDTNTAEIRNLRGDGSKETVNLNDPAPSGP